MTLDGRNGREETARLLDFKPDETAVAGAGGDAGFDLLHGAVVAEGLLGHARAAPAPCGERVARALWSCTNPPRWKTSAIWNRVLGENLK